MTTGQAVTTANKTKGTTLVYDFEACGRCGGSGSYSYCQMYGSVCFDCKGKKRRPTKAGAQASAAVQAFIAERFSVLVEDLKPGDRIKVDGRTVTVATVSTSGGSRYGVGRTDAGETIWKDYVEVTFVGTVRTAMGPVGSHGFCQGTKVVKAVSGADWDAVVEFARTIKKGVTVVDGGAK